LYKFIINNTVPTLFILPLVLSMQSLALSISTYSVLIPTL